MPEHSEPHSAWHAGKCCACRHNACGSGACEWGCTHACRCHAEAQVWTGMQGAPHICQQGMHTPERTSTSSRSTHRKHTCPEQPGSARQQGGALTRMLRHLTVGDRPQLERSSRCCASTANWCAVVGQCSHRCASHSACSRQEAVIGADCPSQTWQIKRTVSVTKFVAHRHVKY